MTPASYPPPRPQSVGELLDAAFRSFRLTLLACLPYAALAMIAGRLPEMWDLFLRTPAQVPARAPWPLPGIHDMTHLLLVLAAGLLTVLFCNATLLRQHARLTHAATGAGPELWQGARRAPAAFALIVLSALAGTICVLPARALPAGMRLWAYLLLAVPAAGVLLLASCAWPVLVLEGRGVLASLRRGLQLAAGQFPRIAIVWAVGAVAMLVFFTLCVILLAVLYPPLAGGIDLALMTALSTVLVVVLGGVAIPLCVVLTLAVYGDLRARREGTDLEQRLAAVASV